MDFTADMDGMIDLVHGVAVTIAGVPATAIPFEPYAESTGIDGTSPSIYVMDSNLPAGVTEGTTVVIGVRTFAVCGVAPDGTGRTGLDLEYVSG